MKDLERLMVDEEIVLEKFEGDPVPENLVERVYLKNGKIIKTEKIGGDSDSTN